MLCHNKTFIITKGHGDAFCGVRILKNSALCHHSRHCDVA